jgi:site-specific recombinase XerD
MVEAGVDIATVSKILGHSSIMMTMRYAHPGEKTMRAAAEKLGKIYEQTRQKVDSPTEEVKIRRSVSHSYIYN